MVRLLAAVLLAGGAHAAFVRPINQNLVSRESKEVFSLRGAMAVTNIRYFSLAGPGALSNVSKREDPLSNMLFFGRVTGSGTYLFRMVAVMPAQPEFFTLVVTDPGVSSNLDVNYVPGTGFVAVGGDGASGLVGSFRVGEHGNCPGWFISTHVVALPPMPTIDSILGGAWLTTDERWKSVFPDDVNFESACVDVRHKPGCLLDGKVSLVFFRDRWHLFVRSNARYYGGRTLAHTVSEGDGPEGPFGAFSPVSWVGFDILEPNMANIYYGAIRVHPTDAGMLIGLFPLSTGLPNGKGDPNANTGGYIALAFSCDGMSWSEMAPLVYTPGVKGRTDDHPVNGYVYDATDSTFYFYVQHHVPDLSADAKENGHVRQYTLQPGALESLTASARSSLSTTCPTEPPAESLPPAEPSWWTEAVKHPQFADDKKETHPAVKEGLETKSRRKASRAPCVKGFKQVGTRTLIRCTPLSMEFRKWWREGNGFAFVAGGHLTWSSYAWWPIHAMPARWYAQDAEAEAGSASAGSLRQETSTAASAAVGVQAAFAAAGALAVVLAAVAALLPAFHTGPASSGRRDVQRPCVA